VSSKTLLLSVGQWLATRDKRSVFVHPLCGSYCLSENVLRLKVCSVFVFVFNDERKTNYACVSAHDSDVFAGVDLMLEVIAVQEHLVVACHAVVLTLDALICQPLFSLLQAVSYLVAVRSVDILVVARVFD
jgi:hypothetical protein